MNIPIITFKKELHYPLQWKGQEKALFVGEVSDLHKVCSNLPGSFKIGDKIIVQKEGGTSITFEMVKTDMDGSNEDCYGWNFKSVKGSKFPCRLLIIND